MIEHEMLFLGLLMEGPKHGYDIKRKIQDELADVIGVRLNSIYYPLKRMEESGLITKESGREGNRPEKYVYKISPKGRKRFNDLLETSFISVDRPFFQIDLSLYFLQYVDRSLAKRRLKGRLQILRRIRVEIHRLKETNKSRHLAVIIRHHLDLVDAEIAFMSGLTETI